jgi:hypothetical protein
MRQGGSRVLSGLKQVVSPVTGRTYDLTFVVVDNGKEIVLVNEAPKAEVRRDV